MNQRKTETSMADVTTVELDDIIADFEKAYEEGNEERIRELWNVFSKAVDGDRQDVVNSLLDDIGDGKDVEAFLETLPEDIEFEAVPGMGEEPKDSDMPPFLQGGAF